MCVEKTSVVSEKIIRNAKGEKKHHYRNEGRGKVSSVLEYLPRRAGKLRCDAKWNEALAFG